MRELRLLAVRMSDCGLWIATMVWIASAPLRAEVNFQREIQPFFAEYCLECHGADVAKGGLALTTREGALKALKSGEVGLVPGKPELSEILKRLESSDQEEQMPPLKKLKRPSAKEIAKVKAWIAEGAPWAEHWAYRSLAKTTVTEVEESAARIDAWIGGELRRAGLLASPEASKFTLLKRVYYDLLGLLPGREEADAFLKDAAPGAYERMVERALASPHFGERWGRHWLDQARYADSDGYEKDSPRPDAWRYRDWVIRAVNEDVPLDRFTIEQLAGDLLDKAGSEQVLATAFHRQTLTNREGGVDQEQYRVEAVFDRTETTGSVWLGLTVGCARCHSHKYDAISQREYYGLFAFFNSADEMTSKVGTSVAELEKYQRENAVHLEKLEGLRRAYREAREPLHGRLAEWEVQMQDRLRVLSGASAKAVALPPTAMQGSKGSHFELLEDQSVRVTGEAPLTDRYTLEVELPEGTVSGFRLEVLPDDSLPSKGPGRSGNGNFVLSRFEVERLGALPQAMAFHSPKASYSQTGFAPEGVLDRDSQTGWAVGGGTAKPQQLSVQLVRPQVSDGSVRVRIHLDQAYTKASKHLLGRFRIQAVMGETADSLLPSELKRLVDTGSEKWTVEQRENLVDWLVHFDGAAEGARRTLEEAEASGPRPPMMDVRVLGQRRGGRETRLFHRGEFLSPRDPVQPGVPSVLPPLESREGGVPDRLDFARWLMGENQPLTARVLANQIWMRLFGEGLVRSVGDFGVRGEPPTHPELLDFLASRLRDHGWSRKDLIRAIVRSATYRQSSETRPELMERDPLNRLLARQNRLRVEGEIVRDLYLGAAGLLSSKVGGPSVFPPMPPEIAALSYANNFKWTTSKGEDRYRRGMYTFFKRTAPYPDLMTFDCPDANVANLRRTVSNTPLQALTTLNSETFSEASRALAQRIVALEVPGDGSVDSSPDGARLEALFRSCLLRAPEPRETGSLLRLLRLARAQFVERSSDAALFGGTTEQAAWAAVARVVLNTDEFITRD